MGLNIAQTNLQLTIQLCALRNRSKHCCLFLQYQNLLAMTAPSLHCPLLRIQELTLTLRLKLGEIWRAPHSGGRSLSLWLLCRCFFQISFCKIQLLPWTCMYILYMYVSMLGHTQLWACSTLSFAFSKLLTTGVTTNKRFWPRLCLPGVLDSKMAHRGRSVQLWPFKHTSTHSFERLGLA